MEGRISRGQLLPYARGEAQAQPNFGVHIFMHIPFDAELPNLTYIVTQWGVCNLGTATPPIARERPFQRSPTLGYPVFMLTSFNAERQNSA